MFPPFRHPTGPYRCAERGDLLLLRAEMKLPGLAWLELSIGQAPRTHPLPPGLFRMQTARLSAGL
jgi:hypothetical protein